MQIVFSMHRRGTWARRSGQVGQESIVEHSCALQVLQQDTTDLVEATLESGDIWSEACTPKVLLANAEHKSNDPLAVRAHCKLFACQDLMKNLMKSYSDTGIARPDIASAKADAKRKAELQTQTSAAASDADKTANKHILS